MPLAPKAIALLSGGLDSRLAIMIVKEQGIQIEAVNFQTMFSCCKDDARQVAYDLGVSFTLIKAEEDYLERVRNPKHGYGRGINPCVDCRTYMFERAKALMRHTGASFMITGEVLGQRPMSQKKSDFEIIERDSGLEGLILRPLSAKLLPVTIPEREGLIDRSKLYAIQGRTREKLYEVAKRYGIHEPPPASAGCALTQPPFADKVRDLFEHDPGHEVWKFELLNIGRHFRLSPETKVILGRNETQNAYLEELKLKGLVLLRPHNFAGPAAIFIGKENPEMHAQAASLVLRYAQKPLPVLCEFELIRGEETVLLTASEPAEESFIEGVRIA